MAKAKKKEEHIPGATARRLAPNQVEYLENTFKDTPNPPEAKRREIGKLLEMDERKVMIWFQNKRQRVKQKQRENDNSHLKNTNAQLTHELESEKRREFQLVQSVGEVAPPFRGASGWRWSAGTDGRLAVSVHVRPVPPRPPSGRTGWTVPRRA